MEKHEAVAQLPQLGQKAVGKQVDSGEEQGSFAQFAVAQCSAKVKHQSPTSVGDMPMAFEKRREK